jgi:hypothetical protein
MKKNGRVWSRIARCSAVLFGIAWAQTSFALTIISMPSDPGQWLAYVDMGTGTGGTFDTEYIGGVSTFGQTFQGGPAVPGGFPTNMGAFVNLTKGTLGVLGGNPFTGVTSGLARFEENFQFTDSGTITSLLHFQGTVSGPAGNSPADPFAYLRLFVQLQDLSEGGHVAVGGYSICSRQVFDCASVQPSISKDIETTLDVKAGHVYQLLIDTSGTAVGPASFDGIDPTSISLQLSPGLKLAPINGIPLPAFLAAPAETVPEPATQALLGLGLAAALLVSRKRKQE